MQRTMSWGKLIFLLCVLVIAFFLARGSILNRTARLREAETGLRVDLSEALEENSVVKSQIDQVGTDAYVESRARKEFEFINPGELRFAFTNPDALTAYTDDELRILNEEMQP